MQRGFKFPFVSKIVYRDHVHMESPAPGPNNISDSLYISHYLCSLYIKTELNFLNTENTDLSQ